MQTARKRLWSVQQLLLGGGHVAATIAGAVLLSLAFTARLSLGRA